MYNQLITHLIHVPDYLIQSRVILLHVQLVTANVIIIQTAYQYHHKVLLFINNYIIINLHSQYRSLVMGQ